MPAVPVWLQDTSTSEALSPFSQRLVVANTCISTHALPLQHCEARCLVAPKVTTDIRRGQRAHLTICRTSANIVTCPLHGVVSKATLGQDVHPHCMRYQCRYFRFSFMVSKADRRSRIIRVAQKHDKRLIFAINDAEMLTATDVHRQGTIVPSHASPKWPPACCIKVPPRQ